MTKKKEMDIVFLLDRSGSMSGSEEDTIGGYNSYLDKQRKNKFNTKVTTILFDNEYEVITDRKSIENVSNLTKDTYFVRGSTALLDAIGKTINSLDKKVKDIFIDEKIDKDSRDLWPLLVDSDDNILWIAGLKKSKFDKQKEENYDIIVKYL